MNVLITYDLVEDAKHESKHSQVKKTMKEGGYMDSFTVTGDTTKTVYTLPNTTLWKKDTTPDQAKKDLQAAVAKHSATLERMIATEFTSTWAAIPGKPYKS